MLNTYTWMLICMNAVLHPSFICICINERGIRALYELKNYIHRRMVEVSSTRKFSSWSHFINGRDLSFRERRDSSPVVVVKKKKWELGPSRNVDFIWIVKGLTRCLLRATRLERPSSLADIFTWILDLSGVPLPPPQSERFKSRQTFWRSSKDSSHESSLSYRYCRPLPSGSYILISP